VLYHYKRPGDWLWTQWETSSLQEDAHSGRLHPDWRFRIDGDSQDYSLADLVKKERANQPANTPDAAEAKFLAPDGTWGVISVILSVAYISILLFGTGWNELSGLRVMLLGMALGWMGWGIRKIKVARAWKRDHSPKI
jgi:hypothetical protein